METVVIFITTYNDSAILPHTIAHYRHRFSDCRIIVYDNFSSDNTPAIALKEGCEVRHFYTAGTMDDQAIINVKNNCWKGVNDWVIICDADELLDICHKDLDGSFTIIDAEVIEIIGGMGSKQCVIHDHHPRKMACFNANKVQEIHYGFGCHAAYPFGEIIINKYFKIHHYKYISEQHLIERNKEAGIRLSERNKKQGLSFHYLFKERKIRKIFRELKKKSIVLFI